ncbi:phosphohistidine phosphatase SixA, partial [Pasteurella multocida subsp. multocida str. Anand1_cattle]
EQINGVYANQLAEKVETWDGITPYGNSHTVVGYLDVLAKQGIQSVLIVSHLPLVGEIVVTLCGRNSVSFYPSTIASCPMGWKNRQYRASKISRVNKHGSNLC